MSTTPTAAAPRPWWRGWADFWFRRSDPTTLGFIRIATGLLVLYVHLAYSFDLQAFFGQNGWYNLKLVERERRELPTFVTPFADWESSLTFTRLSEYPHRRQAMMEFLRAVPGPKGERDAKLAYLYRADVLPKPGDFRRAVDYAAGMVLTSPRLPPPMRLIGPDERENQLKFLATGKVERTVAGPDGQPKTVDVSASTRADNPIPDFFEALTPEQKVQLADELRAFCNAFVATPWPDAVLGAKYVLQHLGELGQPLAAEARRTFVQYIRNLPDDDAARKQRLNSLEYWGVDDQPAYRRGHSGFSVWFHVTDPAQMAVVHGGVIVLIVLFTVGLFTRVTSVLVWVACIGYIHRTQQVLFGMDTMMNILLFYLMIGNSGAVLSLDRLIARYRAARASLARSGTIDAPTRAFLACPPPSVACGFAIRLLQVHVCFIYAAAGLAKLKGGMWWTGQAFWEVVVNPEFTMLHYQWYETSLRWMASSKPVYHIMCTVSVWFTLFIEIALPFLVWTRARWLILLLATAMHAAIGVLMGLNLFELFMIVMFLSFLPDRVIRDRFRGGPDLPRFTFAFNPAVPAHARAAATALALDADNQVTLAPDKSAAAVAVSGPSAADGSVGARALSKGLRFLSLVSFVFWIPGVRALLARRLFPQPAAAPTGGVKPPAPSAAR